MLGKINIDFQVLESGDPKILMIADYSTWLHIEDDPAVISITLPGSSKPVKFNLVKKMINAYNSNNLGLSCSYNCDDPDYIDLPDGVYEIFIEGSPNKFNKKRHYLKLDATRLEFAKQVVKLDLEYSIYDKDRIEHFNTIDFLLLAATSAAKVGDIPKASQHFKEALKLLEKYKECKNCH